MKTKAHPLQQARSIYTAVEGNEVRVFEVLRSRNSDLPDEVSGRSTLTGQALVAGNQLCATGSLEQFSKC